jgi:hypothetical protein
MKMEKAKYSIYDDGQLYVSISKGNQKMGNIPQFNTLPGNVPLRKKDGTLLCNIHGTCSKYCKLCSTDCYAIRAAIYHNNSCILAWGRNTVLLRNDPHKVHLAINEYCRKNVVKYFRFHSSGELESYKQLLMYVEICKDNPDVTFYIYTKAFDILHTWFCDLEKKGESVPENLVINLSEWHGNIDDIKNEKYFKECNIFAYDDGDCGPNVDAMQHCPAVNKDGFETGVTCAQCLRCMKKGNITAVYTH